MQFPGYDDWKTTDPDEGEECPMCGGLVESGKYEGSCTNPKCDYGWGGDYESYRDTDYDKYW